MAAALAWWLKCAFNTPTEAENVAISSAVGWTAWSMPAGSCACEARVSTLAATPKDVET